MKRPLSFYDIVTRISATITNRGTKPVMDAASQTAHSANVWIEYRGRPGLLSWAERREAHTRERIRGREGTVVYRWGGKQR